MENRLTLPLCEWPELDRILWESARVSAGPFKETSPAARWRDTSADLVQREYGMWLAFHQSRGSLTGTDPWQRVTIAHVDAYYGTLIARVAPITVAARIYRLGRMICAMYPTRDWTWLRNVYQYLNTIAVPKRDKRQSVVPAKDLYDLGIALMKSGNSADQHALFSACEYRDGLAIALLTALPLRLSNLASIVIGIHLQRNGSGYRLSFRKEEVKNHKGIDVEIPSALCPHLDEYLLRHRRVLINRGPDIGNVTALWLNRSGAQLDKGALRSQIERRTESAFGHAIWPQLFRDCAATSIAIEDPENVGIATELLGHSDQAMTRRHYIQARTLEASRSYQSAIDRAAHRSARDMSK